MALQATPRNIVGGTSLVIARINSPGYIPGSAGWTINQNGSVEFNNGTFRGHVIAGDLFLYTGVPGPGNLPTSSITSASADPFANAVIPGINGYTTIAGTRYAVGLNQTITSTLGTLPGLSVQDTANAPNSVPGMFAAGSSGATKVARAGITTGKATLADVAALISARSQVDAGVTNGTMQVSAGNIFLGGANTLEVNDNAGTLILGVPLNATPAAAAGAQIYANANLTPAAELTSGLAGTLPLSQTDPNIITVTQATATALSKVWPVPANDAQVGTCYRLTVGGGGTWGSTQQTLQFRIHAFGTAAASFQLGATLFPVSTAFAWKVIYEVMVTATGVTGSMRVTGSGTISVTGANLLVNNGTANTTAGMTGFANTTTIDTTTADNVTLQALWGSTTGAPTISSAYSVFERVGA